tara:strand:- start:759 stop:968 length:210 start_codon:yes stop_codon:yes gene_type:complete
MTEEFFLTPEDKTSVVLKTNSDIIKYLCRISDSPLEEDIASLIRKHSDFILMASEKVLQGERLSIKSVK